MKIIQVLFTNFQSVFELNLREFHRAIERTDDKCIMNLPHKYIDLIYRISEPVKGKPDRLLLNYTLKDGEITFNYSRNNTKYCSIPINQYLRNKYYTFIKSTEKSSISIKFYGGTNLLWFNLTYLDKRSPGKSPRQRNIEGILDGNLNLLADNWNTKNILPFYNWESSINFFKKFYRVNPEILEDNEVENLKRLPFSYSHEMKMAIASTTHAGYIELDQAKLAQIDEVKL